jgi:hypothetical protein
MSCLNSSRHRWMRHKDDVQGKRNVRVTNRDKPLSTDYCSKCSITRKYMRLLTTPIHCHTAQFGSELWCERCNPVCYDKHSPTKLGFCGEPECPMKPICTQETVRFK